MTWTKKRQTTLLTWIGSGGLGLGAQLQLSGIWNVPVWYWITTGAITVLAVSRQGDARRVQV